ncbi:MAG TPA: TIM barrel protein, partial [Planctomycetota bacterium]|nr:TIM barrel protein [Planctomycetota bacterium]
MNPVIYFTKFMKGLKAEEIAQKAKSIGFDGLDLAIRKGQAVNPENVTSELPKAMKTFDAHGLSVPLATLEGNAVDPDKPEIESIFGACGQAGIRLIKLGYWVWQKSDDYWARVEQIQAALAKFEKLGRKHNVCALVHTHCDEYYGSNASGAMTLVRNFDPKHVGVYLDPAHLSVDGELLPMGIAIVKSHLRMVAVKSARYVANGV